MIVPCMCGEVNALTWDRWAKCQGWITWEVGWRILHRPSACDVMVGARADPFEEEPYDQWLPLDDFSLQTLRILY